MKVNALLGSNYVMDPGSGKAINREHQRIAEVINDYDPDLSLCWIPPEARTEANEPPYAIMHRDKNGQPYVVRLVQENELDYRLLAWLFNHDNTKSDILADLDAAEAAQKALAYKRQLDDLEYRRDLAESMWNSPKHTYKHAGRKFQL